MQKKTRSLLFLAFFIMIVPPVTGQEREGLHKLLGRLDSVTNDTDKVLVLINISKTYIRLNLADSSYPYAQKAYQMARKIPLPKGIAEAYWDFARYHLFRGQNDSAHHYYRLAIRQLEMSKDTLRLASLHNDIGNVYKRQGNIEAALGSYYKSLTLKERMGDEKAVASTCTNLGHLYHVFGDSANARKFLERAVRLREGLGDSVETANLYVILGNFYREQNQFEKAGKYFERATSILSQSEDQEGLAIANYNYGNFLFAQERFQDAEKYYEGAYKYAEKAGDPEGIASCLEMLGQVQLKAGKPREAARYFERSLVAARQAGVAELLGNVYGHLAESYELLGNYKLAYLNFKEGVKLRDSLFNQENIQKLTSSELNYKHEKEKLSILHAQEKKEVQQKAENFRKNFMLLFAVILIVLVSVFSVVLFRRLRINRMQKDLIQQQNQEILDSIKYAKRIQSALLANKNLIARYLSDQFILFKPRNIVSGDFYWSMHITLPESDTDLFFLALCDSTGHGVPGAFMSLLNIGYLNEAISEKKIYEPHLILNYVRTRLIESISEEGQKDGMDGILVCINRHNSAITYSAANNAPILIRDRSIVEQPCDKMPVGKGENDRSFTLYTLDAQRGDMLYLYTDGFADQFGGPKGKKLMYRRLKELLLEVKDLPSSEQGKILSDRFEEWKGALEQVDDVCVMGIRI